MATVRLNRLILDAARLLQDVRSTADSSSDTGKTFKTSDWEVYANRVIRDMVKAKFTELGGNFGSVFPELMKDSGLLTPVAGVIPKPSDAWRIESVRTGSQIIRRIPDDDIADVLAGKSIIQPTVKEPKFYEQGENIYVLPVTFTSTLTARYVISLTTLSVITSSDGNGKKSTAPGTWTTATRTLVVAMNSNFVDADKNRIVMFITDADTVHYGQIESVAAVDTVILSGTGFPGDSVIASALMEETSGADIPLNIVHDSEILKNVVDAARSDGSRSAQG